MDYSILIVDDDLLCLSAMRALLISKGYKVDAVATAQECLEKLRAKTTTYALAILDYRLGDQQGSDLAQEILSIHSDLYVLIHSGDLSREALSNSWRAGAVGFLEKSQPTEGLLETVRNWCQKFEATHFAIPRFENISATSPEVAALNMIGRSAVMQEVAKRVAKYRARKETVLIVGETGTGKEKIARAFIENPDAPFLVVNCAAYNGNSDLMESELFGYVKGAFTGAMKDQRGLFEEAKGGIVFLDEIHTLSEKAQQKLLRALQEKTVRPVGSSREYPVDFRLIASAKPEIDQAVEEGQFLPDFYERINVLRVEIAPLRERPEDIEPLVAYFCRKHEEESGIRHQFLYRTVQHLARYNWPRNIRELENTVRRLCIDVEDEKILPEHLDARFFAPAPEKSENALPIRDKFDHLLKEQVERELASGVSQREAARRVGIPESSLRRAMRRWESGSNAQLPN